MPRQRLFVDAALFAGSQIALADSQAHYLRNVLRMDVGQAVAVFNGRDGEWLAQITTVSKKTCELAISTQLRPQDVAPDLWLAFAPVKKARIDMIAEKATELGVARLWPVMTRHTSAERVNLDRLRANAIEAAEQCGRLTVPEVRAPIPLMDMIGSWPPDRRLLLLDETGGGQPIHDALADLGAAPCGFLCGPEGGFEKSELDGLRELPFVTAVGLGPRILRAETAALSALACWQSICGDWRV